MISIVTRRDQDLTNRDLDDECHLSSSTSMVCEVYVSRSY